MLHGMLLKRCRQRTGYRASCASRYCDAITIPSCLGSNNGGLNICCRDSPAARQGMIPWPPFVCTIFQTLNWLEIYSARRSTQRKKPFPFSVPRLFIYQRIHFKPFPITYISLHPGSPPTWLSLFTGTLPGRSLGSVLGGQGLLHCRSLLLSLHFQTAHQNTPLLTISWWTLLSSSLSHMFPLLMDYCYFVLLFPLQSVYLEKHDISLV